MQKKTRTAEKKNDMTNLEVDKFIKDKTFSRKTNNSCAVIFSSSKMLERKHGKEIDSYDCVLRFNYAPVRGFEKYVGSKTTHRILGGFHGKNYNFKESCESILRPLKRLPGKIGMKYIHNDYKESLKLENYDFFRDYYIIPPEMCVPFSNPTNGFVGLNYCLNFFNKVGLFGFEDNLSENYHYFDDLENSKYVSEIMRKYSLSNPLKEGVKSAKSSHVLHAHPIYKEKKLIKEMIRTNDNLRRH